MRWLLPVLLLGCAFPDDDLDADGWTVAQGDCEDLNPAIHPAAPDSLDDGIDQNCDGLDPWMQAVGNGHACLLGTDGRIVCNGENDFGQLEVPESISPFVKVAAGDHHTCALAEDGQVTCWGANEWGQSDAPSDLFIDVEAGSAWSLGVLADGDALCWGRCLVPTEL